MKQPEIFKKIGGILQELNDQYDYLRTTADNLNDLELELFVANAHFLKDHAEILLKLNAIKPQAPLALPPHQQPGKPEPKKFNAPSSAEPKYFEPVVQPVKPVPRPDFFRPEPPVTKPEPAKPAEPVKAPAPLLKFEPEPTPVAPPELPKQEPAAPEPLKFDLKETDHDEDAIKFEIGQPDEPAPTIDLSPAAPADSYSFEREEPETIRHELILDEAADTKEEEPAAVEEEKPLAIEEQPEEPVNTPEPQKAITESMEDIQIEHLRSVVTAPVAETPAEPEPQKETVKAEEPKPATAEPALTLNQRLSAQIKDKKGDTAAAPSKAEPAVEPLADIKTAINLNDKLLFVKDLFKGYNLAYTEAIEIVNRFSSFEEADRFLKTNYVTKNNWEEKKETADKFYALLRRRYA